MLKMRSLVELLLFILVVWFILLILVSYNESSSRDSVNLYEAKARLEQLARRNEEILKKADERIETIKNLNEKLHKLQNEIQESYNEIDHSDDQRKHKIQFELHRVKENEDKTKAMQIDRLKIQAEGIVYFGEVSISIL
jgi:hypothetical protein